MPRVRRARDALGIRGRDAWRDIAQGTARGARPRDIRIRRGVTQPTHAEANAGYGADDGQHR